MASRARTGRCGRISGSWASSAEFESQLQLALSLPPLPGIPSASPRAPFPNLYPPFCSFLTSIPCGQEFNQLHLWIPAIQRIYLRSSVAFRDSCDTGDLSAGPRVPRGKLPAAHLSRRAPRPNLPLQPPREATKHTTRARGPITSGWQGLIHGIR
jgi:hypothetical protein